MLHIVFDSAADCAAENWENTRLVPLNVTMGDRTYQDGIDLTADAFYELLTGGSAFPKTSQPAPQDFISLFEDIQEAGDEAICICLSSALSGTYQSARMAKDMVDYDGIHIIDSCTATHGIRILIQRALELREQGVPAATIAAELEELKGRIRILAAVDTLEYLHRGGRLSRTAAVVGSMANIKPIITVTPAGKVEVIAKCLGRLKAVTQIQQLLNAQEVDTDYPLYSLYTYGHEACELLEKKLDARYHLDRRLQVGPTIGAHVGPNVCGILFVSK